MKDKKQTLVAGPGEEWVARSDANRYRSPRWVLLLIATQPQSGYGAVPGKVTGD
ncbi:hypothetical protein TRAPUB_3194 [Trametes pubescens]|uniref:Uncharacterized protein n=1 Tax=Trametes pubescens TaxID=154538 RepID=A0A1M2VEN9_TRAPU|nr:hypothetical protein TRAPUB_3194 [Trametes pubescens]